MSIQSFWDRLFHRQRATPIEVAAPEPVEPTPSLPPAPQANLPLTEESFRYLSRLLTWNEDKRLTAYLDTKGIPTIGIGHNLRAKGIPEHVKQMAIRKGLNPYKRIDEEICMELFRVDVADAVAELDRIFPWWREHDEARKIAHLDLDFNMGPNTLAKFVNTMASWKRKDYAGAAAGLEHSAWFKQVGNRGPRIVKIVRTGVLPTIPKSVP